MHFHVDKKFMKKLLGKMLNILSSLSGFHQQAREILRTSAN